MFVQETWPWRLRARVHGFRLDEPAVIKSWNSAGDQKGSAVAGSAWLILQPLTGRPSWSTLVAILRRLVERHPELRVRREGTGIGLTPSPTIPLIEPRLIVAGESEPDLDRVLQSLGEPPSSTTGRPYRAFGLIERDGPTHVALLISAEVLDEAGAERIEAALKAGLDAGDAEKVGFGKTGDEVLRVVSERRLKSATSTVRHATSRNDAVSPSASTSDSVSNLCAWLMGSTERESPLPVDRSIAVSGVDSLAAIRLQVRLLHDFGLQWDMSRLLRAKPVEIAQAIDEVAETRGATSSRPTDAVPSGSSPGPVAKEQRRPPNDPVAVDVWSPLDGLERALLAQDAMAPIGTFHLAWEIEFPSSIDVDEVLRRLGELHATHDTLRTQRHPQRGRRVMSVGETDFRRLDRVPTEAERHEALLEPFRLDSGACWRAVIWESRETGDVGGPRCLLVFHHVAVDGRSIDRMITGLCRGVFPEELHESTSIDPGLDADVDWWADRIRRELGGKTLPRSRFVKGSRLHHVDADGFGGELTKAVEAAVHRGLPPMSGVVTAWGMTIGELFGVSEAVIGVPFAAAGARGGLSATVLPIVVESSGDPSEILDRVGVRMTEALDHRSASLPDVAMKLESDSDHSRLPVHAVFMPDEVVNVVEGAVVRHLPYDREVYRAGIHVPDPASSSPLRISIEDTVLNGRSIEAMADEFRERLACVASASPGCSASATTAEPASASFDVDPTSLTIQLETHEDADLWSRFQQSVRNAPDQPAVIGEDESITFAELDAWSGGIATRLARIPTWQSGRPVFLEGVRTVSAVAAMLGVVRAGGWYVPIDPAWPDVIRDRVVRTVGATVQLGARPLQVADQKIEWIDPRDCRALPAVGPTACGSDAPLYCMFTSGTTGEPRGVMVSRRGVARLVDDPWFLPAGTGLRFLHAAPPAFDAATLELWYPLANAGTIVCWEGGGADLVGMMARMRRDDVRACWLTSALFHTAVDVLPSFFDELDIVLTGGAVVSPTHASRILDRRPDLALVNGYGPTENTVFTACEPLVAGGFDAGSALPIGSPIRGTSLSFERDPETSEHSEEVELIASGDGVGLGYLGSDGLPEARDGFIMGPGSVRVYRTGDVVRIRPDLRVEYVGRRDGQVKIRGRRIELAGVDEALRRVEGVRDALAAVHLDRGDGPRLGALVVMEPDRTLDPERIRGSLATAVPTWEIPATWVSVAAIPTTRNGKPDRRAAAEDRKSVV